VIFSRLRPPAVILCYHRVFKPERDPHLLSVSPDRFRQHLEVIRQKGQPQSLDHLLDNPARGGVAVTFDDGYLDNLEQALPFLRQFDVPATIYIATGAIDTDREFWWDDLERLVLGCTSLPGSLRLQIGGREREWNLNPDRPSDRNWNVLDPPNDRNPRENLFCELHAAMRPLPAREQQEVLEQLRAATGEAMTARPGYRAMNAVELKKLAAESLITPGAHTISHPDLTSCGPADQEREMRESKKKLEEIIARPVAHFSYPYGEHNDVVVDRAAVLFRSAVTCIAQPVRRRADFHRLPRFLVRDWDEAEFARRLEDFFRG
jgi:peptidoglycan/xylan/chitin deacetylase (PgdA/CDA1 family)